MGNEIAGVGLPAPLVTSIGRSIGDGQAPSIRVLTIDLTSAIENRKVSFGGIFFWAIDSVGVDATLTVKFNEPVGTGVPIKRGIVLSGIPFDDLYISAPAQPGKSLTLLASMKLLDVTNAPGIASLVQVEAADTVVAGQVTGIVDAASAILPARSGRKQGTIYADPANTSAVFLGTSGVTDATDGFPLLAGAAFTFVGEQALYGRDPTAGGQAVHFIEEYKA
jgi:hypothetical protein